MTVSGVDIDTSSKFARLLLTDEAAKLAVNVSPLFLAFLQNKIAAYAEAVVDSELEYDPDPSKQLKAILEHQRLKNFVAAYTELMNEIIDGQQAA